MVHLNDGPLARSFAAQLDDVRRTIAAAWRAATPEAGFVEWAIARSASSVDLGCEQFDAASLPDQRWTEAPVLAAVGYRLRTGPDVGADLDRWLEGMRRLMSRDAVPADRNSFFFSPVELLGLTVGAQAAETVDESVVEWLRQTMDAHGDRLPMSTPWSRALVSIAVKHVGAGMSTAGPILPKSPLDVAVLLWLRLVDDDVAGAITSLGASTLRHQLLELAAVTEPELHGVAERGMFLMALREAVLAAVGGVELHPATAAQSVVGLCRRFPLLVAELGKRYDKRAGLDVSDEYDLQDLLRAVLRLHFTDVRREDWNPSYGGVQSRSDLLLKPERVVVETKMTRKSLGQRELVEQLIVDKAQYRGHPDCRTLVCFVYDPQLRLTNPSAIERDLSEEEPTFDTLVVVSPQGL